MSTIKKKPNPAFRYDWQTGEKIIQVPMKLTERLFENHLTGHTPLFTQARADRRMCVVALDLDGDQPGEIEHAYEHVQACFKNAFPNIDFQTFLEPSRSYPRKTGAYGWIKINCKGIRTELRNKVINVISAYIRDAATNLPNPHKLV